MQQTGATLHFTALLLVHIDGPPCQLYCSLCELVLKCFRMHLLQNVDVDVCRQDFLFQLTLTEIN